MDRSFLSGYVHRLTENSLVKVPGQNCPFPDFGGVVRWSISRNNLYKMEFYFYSAKNPVSCLTPPTLYSQFSRYRLTLMGNRCASTHHVVSTKDVSELTCLASERDAYVLVRGLLPPLPQLRRENPSFGNHARSFHSTCSMKADRLHFTMGCDDAFGLPLRICHCSKMILQTSIAAHRTRIKRQPFRSLPCPFSCDLTRATRFGLYRSSGARPKLQQSRDMAPELCTTVAKRSERYLAWLNRVDPSRNAVEIVALALMCSRVSSDARVYPLSS